MIFDFILVVISILIGGWLVVEFFKIPKCHKCGTPLRQGGYYSENLFCPNVKCKRYLKESYE